jgi:uncharacterized protein YfdQ (DUF2303 family)
MTDPDQTDNLVTAAADLGRRDAERVPTPYNLNPVTSLVVARVREDESVCVEDLEEYLNRPRAPRGDATLYDPTNFADYVNRLTDPDHTTVWADVNAGTVTAVLDDHANADTAGWRRHSVKLALRPDADWEHWAKLDGKLVRQADFAQHVEDASHTILVPDGATMLEVSSSLQASRSASFSQATRTDNGDVQLAYEEQTKATAGRAGNLEVPREFTILVTPWIGCVPIEVIAKLRYKIENGVLGIGYALVRPDLIKIEVFDSIVASLEQALAVEQVYAGAAPQAVR